MFIRKKSILYCFSVEFNISVQSLSCVQILCDHMNRSTPGLPVHHQTPGDHRSVKTDWFNALQPSVSLIFYLVILSIIENRVLKSPTNTVNSSILSMFALYILGICYLVHTCLYLLYLIGDFLFYQYTMFFFDYFDNFCFKVCSH